jgi:beta-aspartyl-dipeptidase (metallo-type)
MEPEAPEGEGAPLALLLRHARLYEPEPAGVRDVLAVGERIVAIGSDLELPPWAADCPRLELEGRIVIPGLIDQHVHIAGGGGEGGPINRTPEIQLTDLTRAGVTTVVGVLGTDGATRSVQGLLAKARALEAEGLTAFIYTGAYEVPTRTITDNPRTDLVLIDRIIGVGEIAVSDQRGSHPSPHELARLAGEARVGGMLGNKAGVLHCHLGSGPKGLEPLRAVLADWDVPVDVLVPSHLNRNAALVREALTWGRDGGLIDLTSDIRPTAADPGAVSAHVAAAQLWEAGVAWDRITFSSDAQGSSPVFDEAGQLTAIGVASARTLWEEVRLLVEAGMSLEQAIRPVTTHVARVLKLAGQGRIGIGGPADLLVLDDDLRIEAVVARGRLMVWNGRAVRTGRFESRA